MSDYDVAGYMTAAWTTILELDGIPGFNQDEEQHPPAKIGDLKRCSREADAILIVTPEYSYSVPGVLKNALDWASRPSGDNAWNGKSATIMGASIGSIGMPPRRLTRRAILRTKRLQPSSVNSSTTS